MGQVWRKYGINIGEALASGKMPEVSRCGRCKSAFYAVIGKHAYCLNCGRWDMRLLIARNYGARPRRVNHPLKWTPAMRKAREKKGLIRKTI
jgi:hypothetical protein